MMTSEAESFSDVSRRGFLKAAGSGLAGASAGAVSAAASSSSTAAPGRSSLKLGLDLFSLRSQGWSAVEYLDYCAKVGVQVVHFSEPRFLGSLEEAHLEKVKAHADRLGLELEAGFGSICPTSSRFNKADGTAKEQLLRMMKVAKTLGSPIVRCYLGSSQDRTGSIPLEAHIENTVKTCKAVRSQALDMGLKIGVENHSGDLQAQQLKTLVEEAGKDYVGALVDAGNATWALEDPHHTLETLAPYTVTTGVRDSAVWETETGAAVMWVPMGEGNVDIEGWARRFGELCPGKTFSLEIINLRGPRHFNYLEPDFWKGYQDVPAAVFAGFLRRAKAGSPYTKVPPGPAGADPESPEFKKFLVEQERRDVEHDVKFCKEVLGIGGS